MKTILFILIFFVAFTATTSGLVMIFNPEGHILNLNLNLLKNTPFNDFMIPGIMLTILVGGINLLAVIYNIQRDPARYNWALAGGFMLSLWIVIQMILIGAAHWLHFIYLGMGVLIMLMAYQLKGKWAA